MAIYYYDQGYVSRANRNRQPTCPLVYGAYIHRTPLYSERDGEMRVPSNKTRADVVAERVCLPKGAPAAWRDPETAYNAMDAAEDLHNRKKNAARVCATFTAALPHGLTVEQMERAVQDFGKEWTRRSYVFFYSLHRPHEHGDDRNWHVHGGMSERKVVDGAFAPEKDRAANKPKDLITQNRKLWEKHINRHLERAGLEERIDARSYREQFMAAGLEPKNAPRPQIHLGKDAAAMERKGIATRKGKVLREIHRENKRRGHSQGTSRGAMRHLRDLEDSQREAGLTFLDAGSGRHAATLKSEERMAFDLNQSERNFTNRVGAVMDIFMGIGGDGVPGSSAEGSYRDPNKEAQININAKSVNLTIDGQTAENVKEAVADRERDTEAHYAKQQADERAFYEAQAREQERDLERER